jgi:tetratricopeptide (TPR) repeat protein
VSDPVFERYKEALKQGHMAVLRGRPKDALARYDEAAKLAEHRALPHLSMGSVLLELGRPREALEAYDRAIERSPTDAAGHRGRAAAMRALGRHTEAVAVEAELARTEAESAGRLAEDEAVARSATRGRGAESLVSEADEAIGAGDHLTAEARLVAAADVYLGDGAFDAALDACQRAVTIAPASAAVHLLMVRVYLAREQGERAVERLVLLDRLLTLEPDASSRADLAAICAERRALDPRIAAIADGGPPPAA